MNRKTIVFHSWLVGIFVGAMLVALGPRSVEAATTTIIGWNFPNSANFVNGLGALVFPLVGVGLFAGIPVALEYRGDFVITMSLIGLLVGSLLGALQMSAASANLIPFGLVVEVAVFVVVWFWKGGTG